MNGHEPPDWTRKAVQGVFSSGPIPTRSVSNEEFPPLPQTRNQARVEQVLAELNGRAAQRLGMTRRNFLRVTKLPRRKLREKGHEGFRRVRFAHRSASDRLAQSMS